MKELQQIGFKLDSQRDFREGKCAWIKGKNTIVTGLRWGGWNETETPNNFIQLWTLMSVVAHVCPLGGVTGRR